MSRRIVGRARAASAPTERQVLDARELQFQDFARRLTRATLTRLDGTVAPDPRYGKKDYKATGADPRPNGRRLAAEGELRIHIQAASSADCPDPTFERAYVNLLREEAEDAVWLERELNDMVEDLLRDVARKDWLGAGNKLLHLAWVGHPALSPAEREVFTAPIRKQIRRAAALLLLEKLDEADERDRKRAERQRQATLREQVRALDGVSSRKAGALLGISKDTVVRIRRELAA